MDGLKTYTKLLFFIFGTTPKSELETEQGCKSRLGANVALKNTWINEPNQSTGGWRKSFGKLKHNLLCFHCRSIQVVSM